MGNNTPPSQMIRVPSPLINAVKELSKLHRSGYTSAVITGLQQLIASIDSTADSVARVTAGKSDAELIAELIAGLDERIATQVAAHVAQLEQRLSTQLGDLKPGHDSLLSQKVELTSGIAEMSLKLSDAWAEVSELRSRLAEAEEDCKRFTVENQHLLADKARTDAAISEQREDQDTKAEQWYSSAKELEQQIERLQQRQSPLSSPPVAQNELLNNTPESQADQSEPLVAEVDIQESSPLVCLPLADSEPVDNIAIAVNPLENIPASATPSNETVEGRAPSLGSLAPLTATKLAKRLDVAQSNVTRNRDKEGEHFKGWSAKRDPDAIAWEYSPETKKYHPVVTATPTAANRNRTEVSSDRTSLL